MALSKHDMEWTIENESRQPTLSIKKGKLFGILTDHTTGKVTRVPRETLCQIFGTGVVEMMEEDGEDGLV